MDEDTKKDGQDPPGVVTVKISSERTKALIQADRSIQHWSVKYADLSLNLRGMEATIHGLQEHKSQIMSEALKEAGISMDKFSMARMSEDGTVLLVPARPGAAQSQPPEPVGQG